MVLILDKDMIEKKLRRMAYEVLENNADEKELILVGMYDSGMGIARSIQKLLSEISSIKTSLLSVILDKKQPGDVRLEKPAVLDNKVVLVVDDVANSGKALLYSLKPLLDQHPKKIQTMVLVERTHKAFPIKPDYVGLSIATTLQEHIVVEASGDEVQAVWLR